MSLPSYQVKVTLAPPPSCGQGRIVLVLTQAQARAFLAGSLRLPDATSTAFLSNPSVMQTSLLTGLVTATIECVEACDDQA